MDWSIAELLGHMLGSFPAGDRRRRRVPPPNLPLSSGVRWLLDDKREWHRWSDLAQTWESSSVPPPALVAASRERPGIWVERGGTWALLGTPDPQPRGTIRDIISSASPPEHRAATASAPLLAFFVSTLLALSLGAIILGVVLLPLYAIADALLDPWLVSLEPLNLGELAVDAVIVVAFAAGGASVVRTNLAGEVGPLASVALIAGGVAMIVGGFMVAGAV